MTSEKVARTFKARWQDGQCPLCHGWVQTGQLLAVTTWLRIVHAGCWVDYKAGRLVP